MKEFKHSLANYPKAWLGYVVSPQKICIQFKDVESKTRIKDRDTSNLRTNEKGTHEMPIDTLGTKIDTLAVGIPLHLYPEVLTSLLKAFKEHDSKYPEHSLKSFWIDYADTIKDTFNAK